MIKKYIVIKPYTRTIFTECCHPQSPSANSFAWMYCSLSSSSDEGSLCMDVFVVFMGLIGTGVPVGLKGGYDGCSCVA